MESKWKPNKPLEAKQCYGTTSIEHPAVQVGAEELQPPVAAGCSCLPHTCAAALVSRAGHQEGRQLPLL